MVTIAHRQGIRAKDPRAFPLVILMDDASRNVRVVLAGVLVRIRHILGRRIMNIIAYLLTFQVAIFLVLDPIAFSARP